MSGVTLATCYKFISISIYSSWHAKGNKRPPTLQMNMAHLPLLVSCIRKLKPPLQIITNFTTQTDGVVGGDWRRAMLAPSGLRQLVRHASG